MKRQQTIVDTTQEVLGAGEALGLMHLKVTALDGRHITLEGGRQLLQFGSCSYLGLETHPKLLEGMLAMANRFGIQLSSSRAYISISPLAELETRLSQIYDGYPVVVGNAVTMIHGAAVPALVRPSHAVVMDGRAHASMYQAIDHVRASGVVTETIPHNRIDLLREKVRALKGDHDVIWFFCESLYSMYGDDIPMDELLALVEEEPRLHLYIDDAHGMSWTGTHGCGRAFSSIGGNLHDRIVITVALGKSFGSGGGAIVVPKKEWADRVRIAGPTLVFSHPPQPSMLGAAHASLDIHMSEEGAALRDGLDARMRRAREALRAEGLPAYLPNTGPINFVPVGTPHVIFRILDKMMQDGYFLDGAIYPAVPMKRGGIRFTITNHLELSDIDAMIRCLGRRYWETLAEEGLTIEAIRQEFGSLMDDGRPPATATMTTVTDASSLQLETSDTLATFSAAEWDGLFGRVVPLDHRNLLLFEQMNATKGEVDACHWRYRYFMVRDAEGAPIVATWCTAGLMKSDFLASAEVSEKIEARRVHDPLYLTERMVMLGSQLSYGDHLYVRTDHPEWEKALELVVGGIWEFQRETGANTVGLRDFTDNMDERIAKKLFELGFSRQILPDAFQLDLSWKDTDELLGRIENRKRRYQLRQTIKESSRYVVRTTREHPGDADGHAWHELYKNVQQKARTFNTFAMHYDFFESMYRDPQWDLLQLHPIGEGGEVGPAVAISLGTLAANGTYVIMLVGLDHQRLPEGAYDQLLLQGVLRAKEVGAQRVELGYTADRNKRRLGAVRTGKVAFVSLRDHDNAMVISTI